MKVNNKKIFQIKNKKDKIYDSGEILLGKVQSAKYLWSPQVLKSMNNSSPRTKTKYANSRYQRPNKSFLGIAITVQC